MGLSVFDEREPYLVVGQIVAASTPGGQGIANAGTSMVRIDHILVSTDDTSPVTVSLVVDDTFGESSTVVTVDLPAGSGWLDGIPPVDLIVAAGLADYGIVLKGPTAVNFFVRNAMTAGKTVWAVSFGGYV